MRAPDPAATARLRLLAGPSAHPVVHQHPIGGPTIGPDAQVDPPAGKVPLSWAPSTTLSGYVRAATRTGLSPPPLQGVASRPGRRGPRLVVAVGLTSAALAVGWAAHGQAHRVAPPADAAPVAASSDDPLLATTDVEVDVEGRVRRPGLVTLPSGARIADAIRAAGGALPGTDTSDLDLAQRVIDGQQLRVGEPGAAAGAEH